MCKQDACGTQRGCMWNTKGKDTPNQPTHRHTHKHARLRRHTFSCTVCVSKHAGKKSLGNGKSCKSTDINLCWDLDCTYNEAVHFSEVINQHEAQLEAWMCVVVVGVAFPSWALAAEILSVLSSVSCWISSILIMVPIALTTLITFDHHLRHSRHEHHRAT